ncbi:hypothetical protein [Galbibacter sp.]|uniref:hypothetical protein n=1 Tax=Galbibacter sp. TaxID=2918471 RepID=UPI002CC2DDBF|nr:hypothetical protein [Galbibacter sp.]HLV62426.1 hypothetical protein [Galbibacter sp.]
MFESKPGMRLYCCLFVLLIGSIAYGQGELPNTPIELEGLDPVITENPEAEEPIPLDIEAQPDVKAPEVPENPNKSALEMANKEVNLMESNEAFLNPGDRFVKKMNKNYRTRDGEKVGATTTQYFGEFRTKSKTVKIMARDHGNVDGDRVNIIINDRVVVPNVLLQGNFRGFYFELEKGFNKIEFRALNEGAYTPNTAQFAVFDDQGNEISSNEWNLATNVKASLMIIKEE